MQVKKAGGKVYGAILTAAEKKAMDLEIQRNWPSTTENILRKSTPPFCGCCMNNSGLGLSGSGPIMMPSTTVSKELVSRYEMEDQDDIWLCTQMLKRIGVDIEAWHKESEANNVGAK